MWNALKVPEESRRSGLARKVVVLGGAGFLGSEIARAFMRDGASVTVVGRRPPIEARVADLQEATVVLGDASDPKVIRSVLDDADHVVHAVGSPNPVESQRNPVEGILQTLPGLITLLEEVATRPGLGITYCSSGGTVYGDSGQMPVEESARCDPITSYGITKLTAEHYVALYRRRYGLAGRVLRISNAYGPTQSAARGQGLVAAMIAAALKNIPVQIYGDGSMVRDYVHVTDIGDAVVRLANVPNGPLVVNVGTGIGSSILDVHRIVEGSSRREIAIEWLPDRGFDARFSILDVSRLRSMIDWQPRSLEKGCLEMWNDLEEVSTAP